MISFSPQSILPRSYPAPRGNRPTSTALPTATATPTLTSTLTNTLTATATNTPTATNTSLFTATNTPTNTATFIPTSTPTATDTPLFTATSTATLSATFTPSPTATNTPLTSATATSTATPTVSPSATTSATITATGTAATATVTATGTAPLGVTPTPQVVVVDPALVKLADLSLALPGEVVTFTLRATNNGTAPATNVTVNDQIPSDTFSVLSASSTKGGYTITGNNVVFNIGTLNPGEVVTMTIRTQVRGDVRPPVDAINTGSLHYSEGGSRTVTSSVTVRITKGSLPATGYPPPEPPIGWAALVIGLGILAGWTFIKRRSKVPKPTSAP